MNLYTHALTPEQATKLRALLEELGFQFTLKQYTLFFAQRNKLSIAVYEKGPKVLVQGKGVEEFVQFELEPKILGEAKLGYEEVHAPEMFEAHFGVDESGKGDFFGPLVISGVYVDRGIARKLLDAGVQDSKRIGSDARIRTLGQTIRKTAGGLIETVLIGPERYNELYEKFNLNVPIYDGQKLLWRKTHGGVGERERKIGRTEWHKEPLVLCSSHLMRRRDRAGEVIQAEDWDLMVLDEAHHARRRSPGAPQEGGPNQRNLPARQS